MTDWRIWLYQSLLHPRAQQRALALSAKAKEDEQQADLNEAFLREYWPNG